MLTKYYVHTIHGPVEVSRREYIEAKISQFMKEPIAGRYSMSYLDLDPDPEWLLERAEQGLLHSQRKLPKGV